MQWDKLPAGLVNRCLQRDSPNLLITVLFPPFLDRLLDLSVLPFSFLELNYFRELCFYIAVIITIYSIGNRKWYSLLIIVLFL